MEAKKIVAVVGAIDVVLLVVCLVLYMGKDRKGPEIFFDEEKQIEYAEGMDEALLLEGVTAVDEKDGDVSDSLLVEKVAGTNGKEVIVTYVARDGANNAVLVLNADVIETQKGVAPNWNEVIETMSDDKDDYNTLYNNLKLEGQVKLNEEGEYPVTLYTVDTDGNRSEVRNLVVKVS